MPRSARLGTPGTLHHFIITGIDRRRIIDNQADRYPSLETAFARAYSQRKVKRRLL